MARKTLEDKGTKAKLVSTARQILNEKDGYLNLTMRSAAKAAGLSPGAPYRHFENGFPELVATLALEGFEEMLKVLDRAARSPDQRERILDVALAYVRFGVERPNMYRAMFSPLIAEQVEDFEELFRRGQLTYSSRNLYARIAQIKLDAFERLVTPLREAQRAQVLKSGDAETFGLALAALVYGLVGEFIDEGLGIRESRMQPWSGVRKEMSRTVIELLLTGLE